MPDEDEDEGNFPGAPWLETRGRRSTPARKVGYWLWRLHPAGSETEICVYALRSLASDGFT